MKNALLVILYFILALPQVACTAQPENKPHQLKIKTEKIIDGLGIPWGLVFISPQELLIAEKNGQLRIYNLTTKKTTAVKNGLIDVYNDGQGGLLDVALSTDFVKSGLIYYTYAKKIVKEGGNTTVLGRARLKDGALSDVRDIFTAMPVKKGNMHFGSRIVVTEEEIFMTVGERNDRHEAQKLSSHLGKILRLDFDGKAKKDNPFVGNKDALPEIYSYGHRNAQGLLRHPDTGELWSHEHGPRGGDEINRILPGKNYGWPVVTFGREYWGPKIGEGTEKPGMESPLHQYTPSIAPCGFAFYSADKIPGLRNHFLIGALNLTHLNAIDIKNTKSEKRLFAEKNMRIREVETGPDGLVYFSTDGGEIYRISPSQE